MGKNSKVWEVFQKVNTIYATCKICQVRYKRSGNTSNLLDHIKRKHPAEWPEWTKNTTEDEQDPVDENNIDADRTNIPPVHPPAKKKRNTLPNMLRRQQPWEENMERKQKLDQLYINMIAEDMEPLRFGEHSGFRKFVEGLECRYTIPSTTYVKEKLLPNEYQRVKDLLSEELKNVLHCSITNDMWTSMANEGLLAITCHYVGSASDKLKSVVLETVKIEQNHTGEVLSKVIDNILSAWEIRNKVSAVVTDNGSNMLNAVSRLKIRHGPCFGHTLNLLVTDTYKIACFNNLIRKCKSIATFFRSSTLAADKLRFYQTQNNKKLLKPIQEVSTRWNSTFFMIKRIMEIRTELALAINVCEKATTNLSAEDYNILEDFISILEPFEIATNEISGDQYITISLIIPLIRGITEKLMGLTSLKTEEGLLVLNSIKECIKLRLKPYESRTPCILGAMLDPRIKKAAFRSVDDKKKKASQVLINELTVELNSEASQNVPRPSTQLQISDTNEGNSKTNSLLDFLRVPIIHTPVSDAIVDVRQYIEKPNIAWSENSFTYWKVFNKDNQLWKLAYKYLCIPATSCPSECLFSKAGQIMVERRSRMKATTLDKLLFLQQNSSQLQ